MNKKIKMILILLFVIVVGIGIPTLQKMQRQENLQEYKCAIADERVIALRWVDCSNR